MQLTTIRFNDMLSQEELQSFFAPNQWAYYENDLEWWALRLRTRIN